jgi:choloylglycine hydrolase
MKKSIISILLIASLVIPIVSLPLNACSRATWLGKDGSVVTGRSMDWPYDFNTHFYLMPRGGKTEGIRGGLVWEHRYGAVVAAGAMTPGGKIDGVFDGLNEKGLGANRKSVPPTEIGAPPTEIGATQGNCR